MLYILYKTKIKLNQNNKFDNLIKYVNNFFDENIYLYENDNINNINNKKQNLKLSNNIIKNIEQPLDKENDNKSISDKLLNIPDSYENRLKPEIMEIKFFENHNKNK